MDKKDPAFPHGMNMLSYFTGQAMLVVGMPNFYVGKKETEESIKKWADQCVELATAAIDAINKKI